MIFELQLFADVTIDNNAAENGKVVGQSDPINFTVTTVDAQVNINIEELSDEIKAALESAGSLVGTLEDGTEVTVNSDGSVSYEGDLDELIGQSVKLSASGEEQSATVTNATPYFLTDAEGNAVEDNTYTVFASDDEEQETPYTVVVSGGKITSISNAEGDVSFDDLPDELVGAASESQDATTDTANAYEGSISAAGLTFDVVVDASGNATFTSGGTDYTNGYTQEGVEIGTYKVDAESLESGTLKATSLYGLEDIAVEKKDGSASIAFANGVAFDLVASDTKSIAASTGAGEYDSATGKLSLNGVTYSLNINGDSGTLVAESAPSYSVNLNGTDTAITGSDVVNYTAKAASVTLNYEIAAHDSKSSDTLTAKLAAGTGYEIVDAAAGTFKLTGAETVYTATTKVDAAALTLSGEVLTPGGTTSSETFTVTSGIQTATFSDKLSGDVHLITTDGSTWSLADSDTTFATGLDSLTVNYDASANIVTASLNHGLTLSEAAKFVAGNTPGEGETSTITATEISPAVVDADGSDTLSFKVTTLNSADTEEYKVDVVYNTSSEVTSAKLGDTALTLGEDTKVTLGGSEYLINLNKDAMSDGNLDAGDLSVTVNQVINLSDSDTTSSATDGVKVTAANTSTVITYKYTDDAYYAFFVDDSTGKLATPTESKSVALDNGSTIEWTAGVNAYYSADGTTWEVAGNTSVDTDSGVITLSTGGNLATTTGKAGTLTITSADINDSNNNRIGREYTITPANAQSFTGAVTNVFNANEVYGSFYATQTSLSNYSSYGTQAPTNGNSAISTLKSGVLEFSFGGGVTGASETFSVKLSDIQAYSNKSGANKAIGTSAWYADIDIGADLNQNGTIESSEHFKFDDVNMTALLSTNVFGSSAGVLGTNEDFGALATVKGGTGSSLVGGITSAFGSGAGGLTFYSSIDATTVTAGTNATALTAGSGSMSFTIGTNGTITMNYGKLGSNVDIGKGLTLNLGTALGLGSVFSTATFGTSVSATTAAQNLYNVVANQKTESGVWYMSTNTAKFGTATLGTNFHISATQLSSILGGLASTTALATSFLGTDADKEIATVVDTNKVATFVLSNEAPKAIAKIELGGSTFYTFGTAANGSSTFLGAFDSVGANMGSVAGAGVWFNGSRNLVLGAVNGDSMNISLGTDSVGALDGSAKVSDKLTTKVAIIDATNSIASVASFYADLAVPNTSGTIYSDDDTFNNQGGKAQTSFNNFSDYVAARNAAAGTYYQHEAAGSKYNGVIDLKGASLSSEDLFAAFTYETDTGTVGLAGLYTNSELKSVADSSKGSATGSELTIGDATYVLSATTYSDITLTRAGATLSADAYTAGENTEPTTAKAAEYAFSDSTVSFTVSEAGVITAGTLASGSDVTVVDGVATWSDTSYNYSAKFNDAGTVGTVDASDTIVVTKLDPSVEAGPAHYEGTVTIDGKTYTAKTDSSDVSTAKISIYNEAGSDVTTQASALYTFKLNDNGTAEDTSDDFFTYYDNNPFNETAELGAASVTGSLKDSGITVVASWTGSDVTKATFTINGEANTYTAADGTTYTIVDPATGLVSVTTGANGTSETFTADSTVINRTISGAKIGGVDVTITESGTSAAALNLVDISGEGVTFSGTTLTIAGMNYSVSGSASNYTAAGSAEGLNQDSTVNVIATTYSFTDPAGTAYNVAIKDGKVYSYADGAFGAEQSDITVAGDITYTFSYANGTANAEGKYNNITTYTTASELTATEVTLVKLPGTDATVDLREFSDNTYTTTYGGVTYKFTYDEDNNKVSYITNATFSKVAGEDEEAAITIGDTVLSEGTYTATWTYGEEGSTMTTTFTGSPAEIIAAIQNSGVELGGDAFEITIASQAETTVTTEGIASASFITDTATQTTYAIVNNEAEVAGTVLTFTKDGATYTSASAADGREVIFDGTSLTLAGKEDAVLAEVDEDGVWHVAEGVDNIVNTTGAPLEFVAADGDAGVLAEGASYNTETNELTNAGEGSLVKNETGYASSNGSITGVEDASYDDEGNLILSGASDGAKVGDTELPVSGDDNFGATLGADGSVKAVDGVSDGATVDISKVDEIGAEEGAEVTLIGDGEAKLNGADIAVSGDEDGIKATAAADGVSAISDLDSGATASVPAGTPVSTDGSGEFNLNGKALNVTGDADGVTLTPNEDGSYALDGLNGTSEGDAFLTSEDELTVAIGDDTYAVGPDSSLKADASGAASSYDKADKSVDDELEALGLAGQNVTKLDADQITTDEDGNKVLDLSDADPGIFRLPDDEEPYTVELPEAGGSTAIIPDGVECDIEINGSDKGDKFVNLSKNAKMTARGGAGPDFFKSASPDDVLDLSAGGQDTLDVMENGAVLVGYDPTAEEAPAILVSGAEDQDDFIGMIKQGEVNFGDNKIGNVSLDDLAAEDDRTLAKFVTGDGESQLYAWTGNEGGELDVTDLESPVVAVGNSKGDHEGTKINLGEGNTGIAGKGDEVRPGAGSTIELVDNAGDDGEGAKIDTNSSSSKGTVQVNGFVGGFDKGAHGFKGGFTGFTFLNGLFQFITTTVTYAVAGVISSLKNDEEEDVISTTATSTETADATNPSSGVLEYKMTGDDGTTTNNVAIASDKEYTVNSEYAGTELNFIGESTSNGLNGTSVNFAEVTDDVQVDLSGNLMADNYNFYNIQDIKGGAGNSSLVGADGSSNGLHAGSGNSSIWSAAGNDSLYGNTETDKKESTFVFIEGTGNDTLMTFDYGSGENDDKIDFMGADLNQAVIDSSGNLKVALTNGDTLTVEDANNKVIKAKFFDNDMVVELGDNLTYDANVDFYGALNGGHKLTASGSEDVAIYMNNFDGGNKVYNDVTEIDGSGISGNASLAGHDYEDNVIRGGSGANSLWGGLGGDDTLVGGSGSNTFFYLLGDGNDTISNAQSGDVVELLGISIEDIDLDSTIANSSTSAIEVKFNDGGSLKVTGTGVGNVGFKVGGQTWRRSATEGWKKD